MPGGEISAEQTELLQQSLEAYKGLEVMLDENIPAPDEIASEETIVLPEIQSMSVYIRNHYEQELINNLYWEIRCGKLPVMDRGWAFQEIPFDIQDNEDVADPNAIYPKTLEDWAKVDQRIEQDVREYPELREMAAEIYPRQGEITWIDFWRTGEYWVEVDLTIEMEVEIRYWNFRWTTKQKYRVDMFLDTENELSIDYGNFRVYHREPQREGIKLDEFLIPVFGWEDIEEESEEIIRKLSPKGLDDAKYLDANLFAERLGLKVVSLPLYQRPETASILFFEAREVQIGIKNEEGEIVPASHPVEANTIVLNDSFACEKKAIFHECFHYVEHRMFYQLQHMYNNDIELLAKWKPVKLARNKRSPLEWIEWQAQVGSECLMMPRTLVRRHIKARLKAMEKDGRHMGYKLQSVGKLLAKDFGVYNYQMRNRMIHVGYREARGSLNYVDKGYIVPFTFDMNECRRSQTFVITPKEMIVEYVRNEKFRAIIDTGRYIYVDGHICVNDEKYVCKSGEDLLLTRWANEHVDACCLRFVRNYNRNPQTHYICGQLNSDEEYNGRSLTLMASEKMPDLQTQAAHFSRILKEMPSSFHEAFSWLMDCMEVTVGKLAEETMVSDRTIQRYRNEERKQYTADAVAVLCIGLHLDPLLSMALLERAGICWRNTPEDLILKVVLLGMYRMRVSEVRSYLKDLKYTRLDQWPVPE